MTDWNEFLHQQAQQPYYIALQQQLEQERQQTAVYPPQEDLFSCFSLCPYPTVKVVLLGQDPYHRQGQAHGLSFSVQPGVKTPPSLRNIFQELESDLGVTPPKSGCLIPWAKQGVLLLNTSLTVRQGQPGSHKNLGWETFTHNVLAQVNDYEKPLVFLLWGNHAIKAAQGIQNPKHLLLKAAHPSPLAGGKFFGSRPFSQANQFLEQKGRGAIDWALP